MSDSERLVIIGADAAGMGAAAEGRRTDQRLRIVAFDRGGAASYSQCGLPYLVGGLVPDTSHLIARTVEQFARQDIEARCDWAMRSSPLTLRGRSCRCAMWQGA